MTITDHLSLDDAPPPIALAVACPFCGAQPGRQCRDITGQVRSIGVHLTRVAALADPEGARRRVETQR